MLTILLILSPFHPQVNHSRPVNKMGSLPSISLPYLQRVRGSIVRFDKKEKDGRLEELHQCSCTITAGISCTLKLIQSDTWHELYTHIDAQWSIQGCGSAACTSSEITGKVCVRPSVRRKSIQQMWNTYIGSDASSWQTVIGQDRHPSKLTSADTEVFERVWGAPDRVHFRWALPLVCVDSSVGVHRLLVRPHEWHLLLVLFYLHHGSAPLCGAEGRDVPVHSQDDKLEQHPQEAHEDLRVPRGENYYKYLKVEPSLSPLSNIKVPLLWEWVDS